jgi:ornithine carbamoyltransferase
MKSILSMSDLSNGELQTIISTANKLKRKIRGREKIQSLTSKVVGLLFEKPSTRTRTSFEVATLRLGGQAVYLPSSELQLSRGEPIKDTARVLGGYLDALVARVYSHSTVTELAKWSSVPVINGLSDLEHPTQVICDLFTIWEAKKGLENLNLTYIGDGNNVCNSLLLGCAITGMNMVAACPTGYHPNPSILAEAKRIGQKTSAKTRVVETPQEGAKNADILYTDVWVSMGEDREKEAKMQAFQGYQINAELLKVAAPDALVMHCLPAHRGQEITDDTIEGRQSITWTQGENKLHGAAAILDFTLRHR